MERGSSNNNIVEFNRADSTPSKLAKCWTFLVNKGNPFEIRLKNNPSFLHDGSMTVWKFVGYDSEVSKIKGMIQDCGGEVKVFCESQTDAQTEERQSLLGVQREGYVFRCSQCPSCFFFDPLSETDCGVDSWEPETVQEALKSHEKAQSDHISCPIYSEVIQ